MGSIGTPEILLIFLVVLLVFGAKRIPEIARGLGHGIREFKDATKDLKREITQETTQIQPPHQGTPMPYANAHQQAPAPAAAAPATAPAAAAPAPPPAEQPAPKENAQPAENRV